MVARTPINRKQEDQVNSPFPNDEKWQEVYHRPSGDESISQQLQNSEIEAGKASDYGFSSDKVATQEELRGNGPWKTLYDRKEATPTKRNAILKGAKKGAPAGIVVTLLLGGGFGLSVLLGPSMLIVHMTETITGKLDMQLASMEARTVKIFLDQLSKEAAKGACATPGIECDLSTMSDNMKKRLDDAGIKVNTDPTADKTLAGRHDVVGLEFENTPITADNFQSELDTNPAFQAAESKAFDVQFAGFNDEKWGEGAQVLGLSASKSAPLDGSEATDDAYAKDVEHITETGQTTEATTGEVVKNDKGEYVDKTTGEQAYNPDGTPVTTQAEADALNSEIIKNGNAIKDGADAIAKTGETNTASVLNDAEIVMEEAATDGNALTSAEGQTLNAVAIAGVADTVCSAYGIVQAVSYGAKVIRAVQMARYAMIFLTTASMIKAGDAKAAVVAYLGGVLTKTVMQKAIDSKGNKVTVPSKAATDSAGYRNLAYGDKGLDTAATPYIAGGGLGGKMSSYIDTITKYLGGKKNADKTCHIVKNPFVGAASLIGGIALMIVPGGEALAAVKDLAAGAVIGAATQVAAAVLPTLLKGLVAGVLVDNNTFGEAAGNAIVSGSGVLMSTLAGLGGNAPLTPDQAVAYTGLQNQVLARNSAADRATHSPLDPSSPNTFMGKVVTQLLPYESQMSSLSSIFTTSASVVSRSLSSIVTPSTFADSTVDDYKQCQDVDYRAINLATDMFCNPIRGIPPQYLDADPVEIATTLVNNGTIDNATGQPRTDTDNGRNYAKFIDNCIKRKVPLGYTGKDFQGDDGSGCFINDQTTANYYVNYIDQRVLKVMDNGYTDFGGGPSGTGGGGATLTAAQVKQLITSYGLPAATDSGSTGYTQLLNHLKSDPNASWATKAMLAGEKNFKSKGGNVKDYLNTAWLWEEIGPSGWPDPYEINCQDTPSASAVSLFCGSTNFQVGGYQAADRAGDYLNMFKKFYPDSQLTSVLQQVIQNSSKASVSAWKYNDPSQQTGLVANYLRDAANATTSNIAPSSPFFDNKTQFLTLILGKDPNIATALNSFAVSDSDLVLALKSSGCGYGYLCAPQKQILSNMIMALYLFDGGSAG